MALTQSAWTTKTVNGKFVASCTVAATTAENDAYTLKTPKELDTSKPFTVFVNTSAASDGAAVPLDIWIGYDDNFVMSGNDSTVAATNGVMFKQLTDDIGYSAATNNAFLIDPGLPVADVVTIAAKATGYKARIPSVPYYIFNLNAGSTMLAHTTTYKIVQ